MNDLFSHTRINDVPLCELMRPEDLNNFFGQQNLFKDNHPVALFLKQKFCPGFIFWGPPGTGKTTLAHILGEKCGLLKISLSAVHSGKKELSEAIQKSKEAKDLYGKRTLLFIDEIHRYNKLQQDGLLEGLEKGFFYLIGATTENPSVEINKALLSRLQIVTLEKLSADAIKHILKRALDKKNNVSTHCKYILSDSLADRLVTLCDGDARRALNYLELAMHTQSSAVSNTPPITLTPQDLNESLNSMKGYAVTGDDRFELISALIKSIRGSDVNAAVLYLAKMLEGGEDPRYIARRLVILASEDVGNANPQSAILASSILSSVSQIGMPESRILLSQLVTYLSLSPKSNKAYLAIDSAMQCVKNQASFKIPAKLINPLSQFDKKSGKGEGYIYPHDHKHHFYPDSYMPDEYSGFVFYEPSENGYEKTLKERLEWFDKQRKSHK